MISDTKCRRSSRSLCREDVQWCGKGVTEDDFKPTNGFQVKMTGFKIRSKRVKRVLSHLDPSKSPNGVGNLFLRECVVELAPAMTKLFKYIVRCCKFPSKWKIGRITPVHKRGVVIICKNWRPLQVLDNISAAFEDTISPQLSKWISQFVPKSQFGFTKDCGTSDYGAMLPLKIVQVLEERGEGILVSLDVNCKGAFDRALLVAED